MRRVTTRVSLPMHHSILFRLYVGNVQLYFWDHLLSPKKVRKNKPQQSQLFSSTLILQEKNARGRTVFFFNSRAGLRIKSSFLIMSKRIASTHTVLDSSLRGAGCAFVARTLFFLLYIFFLLLNAHAAPRVCVRGEDLATSVVCGVTYFIPVFQC